MTINIPGRHLQAPPPNPALWNRENLAWAAGLFEGEGCFYIHRSRGRAYSRMTVTSTDQDVLERFRQIVGCGHIGKQPISLAAKATGSKKQPYRWHVGGRLNVYGIGVALFSWLGKRRRAKFREMIAATTAWQS